MLLRWIFVGATGFLWNGLAISQSPQNTLAELLWVVAQKDNHQIMMASYDGSEWQAPYSIYKSDSPLSSPSIGTDHKGNKIIVFSELYRPAKSRLLKMVKPAGTEEWENPTVFSDYGSENLGASIVVDALNITWVFWSANQGDLDDIVYKKSGPAGWTKVQVAHAPNKVPDYQPSAMLTVDGEVKLVWKTYDFSSNQYIDSNRLFSLDNSAQNVYKSPLDKSQELLLDNVALPSFVSDNTRTIVHFPNNLMTQSMRLEHN